LDERAYEMCFPKKSSRNKGHLEYLHDFVLTVNEAVHSRNYEDIAALIDISSFVDFYILNELYKNIDIGKYSVFMQIRGQGGDRRLYYGPVWDFDRAAGNGIYGDRPERIYAAVHNIWFRELIETPEIFEIIAERWNELRDGAFVQTLEHIEYFASYYENAFLRNFERYKLFAGQPPSWMTGNLSHKTIGIISFQGQTEYLVKWLGARIVWLDDFFNGRPVDWNDYWWHEEVTNRRGNTSIVYINGKMTEFESYVIQGSNYLSLRDVAYALSGTEKQFEVEHNNETGAIVITSGQPYTALGNEMSFKGWNRETSPFIKSSVSIDGREYIFDIFLADGEEYFKLRDLGAALDFGISWDEEAGAVIIDTSKGYTQ